MVDIDIPVDYQTIKTKLELIVARKHYTKTENDSQLNGKADSIHEHTSDEVMYDSQSSVEDEIDSIYTSLSNKQATLVSGTNIRTINGNDLLGSGNITISGGSSNIKFYEISSSDYNPNIDSTVTITITVTDGDGNLVSNHQFTLDADGTDVSLTTNSNGVATHTYTCSSWGLHTFKVRDSSIQINVKGYKTQSLTGVTLYYNDHEVNAVVNHTQNLTGNTSAVNWTNSSASAIPSALRPRIHQFAPSVSSNVRIRINVNGNIQYQTTSNTSNYSLQGNFCWLI